MDDPSKRVGRPDDAVGRAREDVAGRASETVAGYGAPGATPASTGVAAGDPETDARTREIRRDIEQTREEMSETIDAIQEKLRPSNIVSGATQRMKDATTERVRHMTQSAGDAANRMMYRARSSAEGMGGMRENAIPAALLGVGAAWLFMNNRSASRREREWRYGATYGRGERPERTLRGEYRPGESREQYTDDDTEYETGYRRASAGEYGQYGSSKGEGFIDRLKHNPVPAALTGLGLAWLAMSGRSGHSSERPWEEQPWRGGEEGESAMSRTSERASEAASGVTESARQMTSTAQEYGRDAAERIRHRGRRAQSELERLARENPLAVGACALLLGAAVGLSIPETERENEWMGEARDSMVDRAQEMASKAAATAQETAADLAGEAAKRVVKGATE